MIPYILHVALLISVCLLFYKVLLQRETFYRLNRVILVFCLALSFVLPLIPIPQQWALRDSQKTAEADVPTAIAYNPQVIVPKNEVAVKEQAPAKSEVSAPAKIEVLPVVKQAPSIGSQLQIIWQNAGKWLFYLYWIGVAAFGLNLLIQLIVLLYQAYTKPAIKDGKFRIIELSGDKAPCSFGNNIFINPEKYDWDTYSQILLHEKIHIQQRHTLDILMAELVLVLQWFNPFAWIYRKELENNLEFLTDDSVLEHKDVEKASYQVSLLKVSAPHLSLGITTNYNQSLLKKRIVMMNAKKSNLHTMWKYFFLVPLLACLACALNNPVAYAKVVETGNIVKNETGYHEHGNGDRTEGSWFAEIKGDKVRMEFKSDDDDYNWSSSSDFMLSDFPALPKDKKGEFTLKREAGSVLFTGKFDGDQGYGHYKFTADKGFIDYVNSQGFTTVEERDAFTFFMINLKKDYIALLKANGYKDISKGNLISMAALKVDEPFIKMWKQNGYPDITASQLVSAKALKIDEAYVNEIRKAGYTNLTFNELISFKAQHITGEYINSLRKAKLNDGKNTGETGLPPAHQLSAYKAMHIDSSYINSFSKAGFRDIPYDQLTSMKSLNITPEFVKGFEDLGYMDIKVNTLVSLKALKIDPIYIKSFEDAGYKKAPLNDYVSLKSQHIDPEYAKSFESVGLKDIPLRTLAEFKAMNIDAAYIKSFQDAGYKDMKTHDFVSLKSMHISPDYAKTFEPMGYTNIPVHTLMSLKSMHIDAGFIKSFTDAGYNNLSLNDLITLKSMHITPDFAKTYEAIGYKDIPVRTLISLKSMDIDAAFIKSFADAGYKNIPVNELTTLKSLHITPDYMKSFEAAGYKDISIRSIITIKSTGITPEYIEGFKKIGFTDIPLNELPILKSVGVTPEYVKSMQEKGFKSTDIRKYIQLKQAFN